MSLITFKKIDLEMKLGDYLKTIIIETEYD